MISSSVIRTIVLRRQLVGHLGALVALDSLQLVLDIFVDRVIRVVMRNASFRVVFLVNGPCASRLAVVSRLVAVCLVSSIGIAVCSRAPVTTLANGSSASYGTSKASWTTWSERGATLATEGVVKVVRRRARRRTWCLRQTAVGSDDSQ